MAGKMEREYSIIKVYEYTDAQYVDGIELVFPIQINRSLKGVYIGNSHIDGHPMFKILETMDDIVNEKDVVMNRGSWNYVKYRIGDPGEVIGDSDCEDLFFDVIRKNALYEVEGEFYQSASDYALTHTNDEILEKINILK